MTSTELNQSSDHRLQERTKDVNRVWNPCSVFILMLSSVSVAVIISKVDAIWYKYFQNLWERSGDYCQHKWDRIHDYFDGDQRKIAFAGTFIVSNGAFFGTNFFFSLLDLAGFPQFLLKYKIQTDKNCPVDWKLFMKALFLVMFNQTVVAIPVFYLSYLAMKWRGCSFGCQLPVFHIILFEIAFCILIEEIFFYYSHRLFHNRLLYKYIHKKHHEWIAPIGITAIYAHPLEHIICNMLPAITGPLIMGSHIVTAWLWFSMALISTIVAHCGYHLPFIPSPEFHDYHHLKFVNNFGVLGLLDRLHGTDTHFLASDAYKRHIISFSLTPVSQRFPESSTDLKNTY